MTTIVATKTEIGSDLQFTTDTGYKFKGKRKLYFFESIPIMRLEEPCWVGFAGTAEDALTVVDYYYSPELYGKPPKVQKMQGLVLTAKNKLFTFLTPFKWIEVNEPYFAIGSGSPYAMGSMAQDQNIKAAIKAAMKFDASTGMGIDLKSF